MIIKELVENLLERLARKVVRYPELSPYLISFSDAISCQFIVATGADTTHCKSLYQFLSSLYIHEPSLKVVVFDLGLLESERQWIQQDFPLVEMRIFDYSQYPDYFNIKVNAGEYAWKPIIFHDILNEFKCCVCWMDAGNVITEPLFWMRKIAKKNGLYSPRSVGRISDWTHPKTLELLNASIDLLDKPNLSGACVAACYHSAKARTLVDKWKKYALIKECIAPEGSSRENHRQDQALLSVLSHQLDIAKNIPSRKYGFKLHQDIG
jgi:hypothetical protein